jgi:hypothetical protein
MHEADLRGLERDKIRFGHAHFRALAAALAPGLPAGEQPARYGVCTNVAGLVAMAQDAT